MENTTSSSKNGIIEVVVQAPLNKQALLPSSCTVNHVRQYFGVFSSGVGFLVDSNNNIVEDLSSGNGPFRFHIDPALLPAAVHRRPTITSHFSVSSGSGSSVAESVSKETSNGWKVLVLGSGSSSSTPKLGCLLKKSSTCVCNRIPFSSYNHRLNPSILLSSNLSSSESINILVDAGKTFRESVLRHFIPYNIHTVHSVILTHEHLDAIGGLDDIREFQARGVELNVYCNKTTEQRLRNMFHYMFHPDPGTFVASLKLNILEAFIPFTIHGIEITPIPLYHGACIALGFIFCPLEGTHQMVYFSDYRCKLSDSQVVASASAPPPGSTSSTPGGTAPPPPKPETPAEDIANLTFLVDPNQTLQLLLRRPISAMVLDCLSYESNYISHADYRETKGIIRELLKRGLTVNQFHLTGLGCGIDYVELLHSIDDEFNGSGININVSYDGMVFGL